MICRNKRQKNELPEKPLLRQGRESTFLFCFLWGVRCCFISDVAVCVVCRVDTRSC